MRDNVWTFIDGKWHCLQASMMIWTRIYDFCCPHCKTILIRAGSDMIEYTFVWKDVGKPRIGQCLSCNNELVFI